MSSSSSENVKINLCRLCTKSADCTDGNNIFDKCNKSFLKQVKELTGLTIKDMPRQLLPRFVCTQCKEELPRAYNFRRLIIESQDFFKSKDYKNNPAYFNEGSTSKCETQVFDTVFVAYNDHKAVSEDFDTKQALSDSFAWCAENTPAACVETLIEDIKNENLEIESDEQFGEPDIPIKESEEENMLSTNSNTSNSVKEDKEDKEEKQKAVKTQTLNKTALKKTKNKVIKTKKVKNKIPKEKKVIDKKPKEKTPKEKKPKIVDAEKNLNQYVCDKCGAAFQSRPGLVAHLLRHTGERKFGCEICEVKFFSPYELQRHMRFHTGEAPYQCRHCERRFRDYSHRQRHERSKHLNVRPFACTTCGKTFTNNYIAKNHMLTHTKLRQFECKICEKYFLRQTHLVTHYRSNTHKNNAAKFDKVDEAPENQTEANEWSSELMLKALSSQQQTVSTTTNITTQK